MSLIDRSQYLKCFSAKEYLRVYYSEKDWQSHFRGKLYNEFFKKYSSKWDMNNAKLLDFSGGAVILNYISAAPYVSEIVHSAYKEEERKQIELWKINAKNCHDWNPFIKYVVREIEGDTAWQDRVEMLRSKIKIVSCNILEEHPLPLTEELNSFSVICTSFALEAACKTIDDFKSAIKKLVKVLRVGGYIAVLFAEDETFYIIGKDKWAILPISLAQVTEAVEDTGCVVVMSERDPTPLELIENPILFDGKAVGFIVAYKVK